MLTRTAQESKPQIVTPWDFSYGIERGGKAPLPAPLICLEEALETRLGRWDH